jgi:Outer membrane protein beta-barrel domain
VLTWKKWILCSLAGAALAAAALSQEPNFGVGATYGSENDVSHSVSLGGFQPSQYTIFVDYRLEKAALLRLTYGSIWTKQSQAGTIVTTPGGQVGMPNFKERINYLAADVSYLYSEGFYTGGLFGGIGGYQVNPQPVPPEFAPYADPSERVFGFNLGVDGEFRIVKSLSALLRFEYQNVATHPRRQFVTADAGLVARF